MDKECQHLGTSWNADDDEPDLETRQVMVPLFVLMSFSILLLISLTEEFSLLPTALVALVSTWYILRL